jgi:hypothetical protein
MNKILLGLFISIVSVTVESAIVFYAICVHCQVRHMLSTKSADHIVFLKFGCVSVNQFSPLLHFVLGFLIKLVLIKVVLLLQFLSHFPNHIIFEFKQSPLLFVMFNQELPLSQFSWQIVRENVDVDLKVLCDCILNVFVKLAEMVQKSNLIWRSFWTSTRYLLHKH